MEAFFNIRPNIVRCVYTPGPAARNFSLFVSPDCMDGPPAARCPLSVQGVEFIPRSIYHQIPDGPPEIRTIQTVDGQRTRIGNLKAAYDRQGWRAALSVAFAPDEHIYGLGQDEDGVFDKRGRIEYLYQHNMRIPMPVFVSSLGYGVLFNCACLMVFDDTAEVCRITLECADQVDFFVISGTMDEIVAGYRELTGRAAPLPKWAFGYWQSKERYTSQAELLEVAEKYRGMQIPLDVIVQDWKTWEGELWGDKRLDKSRYPDMPSALDALHRQNIHALVSVWPNMNTGGRDQREFAERGMLLGDGSTYNAFDASARKLYWNQADRELFRAGFDGWWCDNTEPFSAPDWCGEEKLPEKARYALVGSEHEKYLDPAEANAFSLMHAKGIFENQPQKPVVNLTRSGWAGIQKYGAILWAGDTSATWEELRREIVKGLSISLCGIPYWTVDAGAFFAGGIACWRKWKGDPGAGPVWFWSGDYDGGGRDKGYQELYTRWLQFACFLPIFRSHGTDTPREIWNFEEPFLSAIANTIRLRYRLMPYIAEMAGRIVSEHFTMMRSLMFDFAADPQVALIDDEFMFGTDLLICPVIKPMCFFSGSVPCAQKPHFRKCYLPKGEDWYNFWTKEYYSGGQYIQVPITLSHIPLFVRAGTILPMQETAQYAEQDAPVFRAAFPRRAGGGNVKNEIEGFI